MTIHIFCVCKINEIWLAFCIHNADGSVVNQIVVVSYCRIVKTYPHKTYIYPHESVGVSAEEVWVALGVRSATDSVLNPVPFGDVCFHVPFRSHKHAIDETKIWKREEQQWQDGKHTSKIDDCRGHLALGLFNYWFDMAVVCVICIVLLLFRSCLLFLCHIIVSRTLCHFVGRSLVLRPRSLVLVPLAVSPANPVAKCSQTISVLEKCEGSVSICNMDPCSRIMICQNSDSAQRTVANGQQIGQRNTF